MGSSKFFSLAGGMDIFILFLLLILSVTSLALIIERYITLRNVSKSSREMKIVLKKALEDESYDKIELEAEKNNSLESKVIHILLSHYRKKGDSGVDELFSAFVLNIRPELERSLNFLATIGSNAPYIGLLGTVLGIMKAFHDLSSSADAGMQTVMAGISSALLATAAGLFVAIPAVMAYNYFQKQVKSILQGLEMARDIALVKAKLGDKNG